MTDRRRLRFNGRVADSSLRGKVDASHFTEGQAHTVIAPYVSLLNEPGGKREREMVFGHGFCVLEPAEDFSFGYIMRDGYVGYVKSEALQSDFAPATHKVTSRFTYALSEPDIKKQEDRFPLSFGAFLHVRSFQGPWARIDVGSASRFVPVSHLGNVEDFDSDPVSIAERFVGTPYVWGGNSAMGIDCSGLVQEACLGCGIACPGDSDMQEAELGATLPEAAALQRGDLLFWKGHVAWVVDPGTILHANAYHMAVAYEPLAEAIARIVAQGDGPVTARKRLEIKT